MTEQDQPMFIQVGSSRDPWTVVAQMREYAEQNGGKLAEAIKTIEPTSNFGNIVSEWEALEWLFHRHAPTGYRFVTAENAYPKFGFELVVFDH